MIKNNCVYLEFHTKCGERFANLHKLCDYIKDLQITKIKIGHLFNGGSQWSLEASGKFCGIFVNKDAENICHFVTHNSLLISY